LDDFSASDDNFRPLASPRMEKKTCFKKQQNKHFSLKKGKHVILISPWKGVFFYLRNFFGGISGQNGSKTFFPKTLDGNKTCFFLKKRKKTLF
jgi:hypothetical protein